MTTFTSKSAGLNIVVKPSRYAYNADGSRYFVPGKRAEFHHGIFTTDDQEIIDFLQAHRDYGVLFVSENKPVPQAEMKAKEERKHKEERALAKKTEAKSTNKKLPVEGGQTEVDPDSDEAVVGQFQNENLIP